MHATKIFRVTAHTSSYNYKMTSYVVDYLREYDLNYFDILINRIIKEMD